MEALEEFGENMSILVGTFCSDLISPRCRQYAEFIAEKGSPLGHCVGFFDSTKVFNSRPGGAGAIQRSFYSGHKHAHCLSCLTITKPDGLVAYMYRPEEGLRHDITLYRKSCL